MFIQEDLRWGKPSPKHVALTMALAAISNTHNNQGKGLA